MGVQGLPGRQVVGRTRDTGVGEVLSDRLLRCDAPRSALVVEERTGQVASILRNQGADVVEWHRFALGGQPATAWPGPGTHDRVVLRLPKARKALEMVLHACAARLSPDGELWIAGGNDEGAKSLAKPLRAVFGSVDAVGARRHCRVWRAAEPMASCRGELDDWAERVEVGALSWWSWPGLFAHGRLDVGTAVLLDHLPALPEGASVLDFGCGAGVIGLALGARGPITWTGVDVDALAVEASRRNVPDARLWCSDGVPAELGSFDLVVSNPPLHTGVKRDDRPLRGFLARLPSLVRRDGAALLVTQGGVQLGPSLEEGFRAVEVVATRAGFRVWRARSPR